MGLKRVQVHPTLSFSNIGNDAVINHRVQLMNFREVGKYVGPAREIMVDNMTLDAMTILQMAV